MDDLFPLYNTGGKEFKERILKTLRTKMQIEEKGEISYALDTRVQIDRESGVLKISQVKYTQSLLEEFNMCESKERETPHVNTNHRKRFTKNTSKYPIRNVIGRLWWLVLVSRPDINCAVHKCAIWQNKPSEKLWKQILVILRYLKHTAHYGIIFKRPKNNFNMSENFLLKSFSDASFASEPDSKSRVGYFYFVCNCLVSWTSRFTK